MKRLLLFLLTLVPMQVAIPQKPEIMPYIDFLKSQQTDPVEYVFRLFEKYDIVILGERHHSDTTQYELIIKIMQDPRFIETVGNVFTEVGVYNRTQWANRILKKDYKSYSDFETRLRKLYWDVDYEVLWGKYNFWQYLTSIYKINKDLAKNKKINVYFTDIPYDWYKCKTVEQRKKEYDRIDNGDFRDSIMGSNFIKEYNKILNNKNTKRKKALVIFNRPHSYQNYHTKNGYILNSAASYIFDTYPDKAANVMLNWVRFQNSGIKYLIANGKWDAAFRYSGNKPVGFNFKDSPMGKDIFDHYDESFSGKICYEDIYTGFIFYKPMEDWVLAMGIPGILNVDKKMIREIRRRCFLVEEPDGLESVKKDFNDIRTYTVWKGNDTPKDSVDMYINYWLK